MTATTTGTQLPRYALGIAQASALSAMLRAPLPTTPTRPITLRDKLNEPRDRKALRLLAAHESRGLKGKALALSNAITDELRACKRPIEAAENADEGRSTPDLTLNPSTRTCTKGSQIFYDENVNAMSDHALTPPARPTLTLVPKIPPPADGVSLPTPADRDDKTREEQNERTRLYKLAHPRRVIRSKDELNRGPLDE